MGSAIYFTRETSLPDLAALKKHPAEQPAGHVGGKVILWISRAGLHWQTSLMIHQLDSSSVTPRSRSEVTANCLGPIFGTNDMTGPTVNYSEYLHSRYDACRWIE